MHIFILYILLYYIYYSYIIYIVHIISYSVVVYANHFETILFILVNLRKKLFLFWSLMFAGINAKIVLISIYASINEVCDIVKVDIHLKCTSELFE